MQTENHIVIIIIIINLHESTAGQRLLIFHSNQSDACLFQVTPANFLSHLYYCVMLLNNSLAFFLFIIKLTFRHSLCNSKIIYFSPSIYSLNKTISSVLKNFPYYSHELFRRNSVALYGLLNWNFFR